MSTKEEAPPAKGKKPSAEDLKWGKAAMAAGYTLVPNVLLEKLHALSIEPLDVCIILFLAKHWWTVDAPPFPSKETIAVALGKSPRQIQRRITHLQDELHYVQREKRPSAYGTNTYRLDGLVKALAPLAREALKEKQKRESERKAYIARRPSKKRRAA